MFTLKMNNIINKKNLFIYNLNKFNFLYSILISILISSKPINSTETATIFNNNNNHHNNKQQIKENYQQLQQHQLLQPTLINNPLYHHPSFPFQYRNIDNFHHNIDNDDNNNSNDILNSLNNNEFTSHISYDTIHQILRDEDNNNKNKNNNNQFNHNNDIDIKSNAIYWNSGILRNSDSNSDDITLPYYNYKINKFNSNQYEEKPNNNKNNNINELKKIQKLQHQNTNGYKVSHIIGKRSIKQTTNIDDNEQHNISGVQFVDNLHNNNNNNNNNKKINSNSNNNYWNSFIINKSTKDHLNLVNKQLKQFNINDYQIDNQKLLTLNLTNNQLKIFSINNNSRNNLRNLHLLDLTNNQLKEFTFNINQLKNLTILNLTNNHVSNFTVLLKNNTINNNSNNSNKTKTINNNNNNNEKSTQQIDSQIGAEEKEEANLKILILKNNCIKTLKTFDLQQLKQLENLDLSCNLIENIEDEFFTQVKNLKQLNLSWNRLGGTDYGVQLQNCSKNEENKEIFNENCNITPKSIENEKIFKESFNNLLNIETLILSHNNIRQIDFDTFLVLPNLQYMDLSNNNIHGESVKSLSGIPDLIGLSLAYNYELGDSLQEFVASWSLKELDISGTGLCRIPAALAQSVRALKLKDNWLSTINCGDLDSYPLLQYLDLSYSNIEEIEDDALGRIEMLETLFLDHNNLKRIPISLPTSLENLFLQYNQIIEIQPQYFQGLLNLKVLDLSGNKLLYLPGLPLPKLLSLNLQSSELKGLSQSLVKESPKLRDLYLDDNPIKCSDLLGIAEWASGCHEENFYSSSSLNANGGGISTTSNTQQSIRQSIEQQSIKPKELKNFIEKSYQYFIKFNANQLNSANEHTKCCHSKEYEKLREELKAKRPNCVELRAIKDRQMKLHQIQMLMQQENTAREIYEKNFQNNNTQIDDDKILDDNGMIQNDETLSSSREEPAKSQQSTQYDIKDENDFNQTKKPAILTADYKLDNDYVETSSILSQKSTSNINDNNNNNNPKINTQTQTNKSNITFGKPTDTIGIHPNSNDDEIFGQINDGKYHQIEKQQQDVEQIANVSSSTETGNKINRKKLNIGQKSNNPNGMNMNFINIKNETEKLSKDEIEKQQQQQQPQIDDKNENLKLSDYIEDENKMNITKIQNEEYNNQNTIAVGSVTSTNSIDIQMPFDSLPNSGQQQQQFNITDNHKIVFNSNMVGSYNGSNQRTTLSINPNKEEIANKNITSEIEPILMKNTKKDIVPSYSSLTFAPVASKNLHKIDSIDEDEVGVVVRNNTEHQRIKDRRLYAAGKTLKDEHFYDFLLNNDGATKRKTNLEHKSILSSSLVEQISMAPPNIINENLRNNNSDDNDNNNNNYQTKTNLTKKFNQINRMKLKRLSPSSLLQLQPIQPTSSNVLLKKTNQQNEQQQQQQQKGHHDQQKNGKIKQMKKKKPSTLLTTTKKFIDNTMNTNDSITVQIPLKDNRNNNNSNNNNNNNKNSAKLPKTNKSNIGKIPLKITTSNTTGTKVLQKATNPSITNIKNTNNNSKMNLNSNLHETVQLYQHQHYNNGQNEVIRNDDDVDDEETENNITIKSNLDKENNILMLLTLGQQNLPQLFNINTTEMNIFTVNLDKDIYSSTTHNPTTLSTSKLLNENETKQRQQQQQQQQLQYDDLNMLLKDHNHEIRQIEQQQNNMKTIQQNESNILKNYFDLQKPIEKEQQQQQQQQQTITLTAKLSDKIPALKSQYSAETSKIKMDSIKLQKEYNENLIKINLQQQKQQNNNKNQIGFTTDEHSKKFDDMTTFYDNINPELSATITETSLKIFNFDEQKISKILLNSVITTPISTITKPDTEPITVSLLNLLSENNEMASNDGTLQITTSSIHNNLNTKNNNKQNKIVVLNSTSTSTSATSNNINIKNNKNFNENSNINKLAPLNENSNDNQLNIPSTLPITEKLTSTSSSSTISENGNLKSIDMALTSLISKTNQHQITNNLNITLPVNNTNDKFDNHSNNSSTHQNTIVNIDNNIRQQGIIKSSTAATTPTTETTIQSNNSIHLNDKIINKNVNNTSPIDSDTNNGINLMKLYEIESLMDDNHEDVDDNIDNSNTNNNNEPNQFNTENHKYMFNHQQQQKEKHQQENRKLNENHHYELSSYKNINHQNDEEQQQHRQQNNYHKNNNREGDEEFIEFKKDTTELVKLEHQHFMPLSMTQLKINNDNDNDDDGESVEKKQKLAKEQHENFDGKTTDSTKSPRKYNGPSLSIQKFTTMTKPAIKSQHQYLVQQQKNQHNSSQTANNSTSKSNALNNHKLHMYEIKGGRKSISLRDNIVLTALGSINVEKKTSSTTTSIDSKNQNSSKTAGQNKNVKQHKKINTEKHHYHSTTSRNALKKQLKKQAVQANAVSKINPHTNGYADKLKNVNINSPSSKMNSNIGSTDPIEPITMMMMIADEPAADSSFETEQIDYTKINSNLKDEYIIQDGTQHHINHHSTNIEYKDNREMDENEKYKTGKKLSALKIDKINKHTNTKINDDSMIYVTTETTTTDTIITTTGNLNIADNKINENKNLNKFIDNKNNENEEDTTNDNNNSKTNLKSNTPTLEEYQQEQQIQQLELHGSVSNMNGGAGMPPEQWLEIRKNVQQTNFNHSGLFIVIGLTLAILLLLGLMHVYRCPKQPIWRHYYNSNGNLNRQYHDHIINHNNCTTSNINTNQNDNYINITSTAASTTLNEQQQEQQYISNNRENYYYNHNSKNFINYNNLSNNCNDNDEIRTATATTMSTMNTCTQLSDDNNQNDYYIEMDHTIASKSSGTILSNQRQLQQNQHNDRAEDETIAIECGHFEITNHNGIGGIPMELLKPQTKSFKNSNYNETIKNCNSRDTTMNTSFFGGSCDSGYSASSSNLSGQTNSPANGRRNGANIFNNLRFNREHNNINNFSNSNGNNCSKPNERKLFDNGTKNVKPVRKFW